MKPNFLAPSLNAFNDAFKQENPTVGEFFENLSFGCMRDLSGDVNKVKTKTWKSPSGKDRDFDLYVLKGWYSLPPLEDLPTKESEDACMVAMGKEILAALSYAFKTEAFATFYKHAVANDKIWKAITNESYGYVNFVTTARPNVEICQNFNGHLTKTHASELTTLLYDNRYSSKKCDDFVDATDSKDATNDAPAAIQAQA